MAHRLVWETKPIFGNSLWIDNAQRRRELKCDMRNRTATKRKLDYPVETHGSRLAAKARKMASKLTPEQKRRHLNEAMVMIYGGAETQKATLP